MSLFRRMLFGSPFSDWSVLLMKFCLLLQVQRFIRLLINRSHSSSVTQYEDYETACERICKVSAGQMILFHVGLRKFSWQRIY